MMTHFFQQHQRIPPPKAVLLRGRSALIVALGASVLCACSPSHAPLPPTAEGLAGTTWRVEEMTVTFKEPPDLVIVSERFGNTEIPGAYRVENGIIEITVGPMTKAGTWDGTYLVIDGVGGVRQ